MKRGMVAYSKLITIELQQVSITLTESIQLLKHDRGIAQSLNGFVELNAETATYFN